LPHHPSGPVIGYFPSAVRCWMLDVGCYRVKIVAVAQRRQIGACTATCQQFSLWVCHPAPGEGTRPTSPTKPPSCRPGALTRCPLLLHNENCWLHARELSRQRGPGATGDMTNGTARNDPGYGLTTLTTTPRHESGAPSDAKFNPEESRQWGAGERRQQFSLWPCHPPPGEGTRPTSPTKPPSCRPGALTRRPHRVHNENC